MGGWIAQLMALDHPDRAWSITHPERWRVAPRLETDVEHPLPHQDRPVEA